MYENFNETLIEKTLNSIFQKADLKKESSSKQKISQESSSNVKQGQET